MKYFRCFWPFWIQAMILDPDHRIWINCKWPPYSFSALLVSAAENGLKCYVGLGNTSAKHKQNIVECPARKYYACVKMFGGGMGDQIRRFCKKVKPQVRERERYMLAVHFLSFFFKKRKENEIIADWFILLTVVIQLNRVIYISGI